MISNDVVQVVRFRNCDNVVRCHVACGPIKTTKDDSDGLRQHLSA